MMGGDWFYSRKPKVVTIPVQDGNRISPMFGNLQERKTMISLQNPGAGNDVPQEMMSENAAAILIQSHFRGYMVRRTDPLNSLRVISSVMSQLRKFKAQISRDEYMHKLRADPEECKKLSESIMSLLLRLDGLQNVHPTVREIRRSVARELVALLDRVDMQLQHGREEIPEDSKASPPVQYNGSADGSDVFLFFQMIKIRISTRNLHF
ncbi:hypothetical protein O6H91_16G047300 [Diphasiastrum complanatum]|uniref:Uncharacterized protein n=1 Tax=Diphasiastrum complanatum TaxID=34168 RepID=A0ACC2BC32_DIPCM|nr:hypothetical protein O6H91_16G047300 [Diphasiastrum complanatum]